MDLSQLQHEHRVWLKANFPDQVGKSYQPLLGLVEEVGELSHAQLKGEQGIRHTPAEIRAMKEDAIGDIVIFLASYCNTEGISLSEAVASAWEVVAARDWATSTLPQAGLVQ